MRILLVALIAAHAPISAAAAVVERMPVMQWGPNAMFLVAPAMSAPTAIFSASPLAAPFAATPLPTASAPVAVSAAVSVGDALPTAKADLTSLGSTLTEENRPGRAIASASTRSALDWAFDRTHPAADGPEPVRAAPTTAPGAALMPAQRARPNWKAAVPNLLTFSNMAGGLAASFLASEGHYVAAALGIISAVVFDALDGRAARALGVKNALGIDLDSLADIVSFGAAPALLIFKAALLPAFGWLGFPIAAAFAAAGLYRLARFNVGAHAEKSGAAPAKASDSFTGLPIPGGAGVIVALTLALASFPAALVAPIATAITLLTAGAMVSRLPYPAFKKGGVKALIAPALVGAAAVVPLIALGLYAFIPAAVFGLYLASGPLVALMSGRK